MLGLKLKTARWNRAAREVEQTVFAPNAETFSAVHFASVSCRSRLARSPGVSGGGAALSSLCRRFPGGDIMNLTSRRSPLSGLSFSLFFFLRERKRGYWRRRSREISVGEAKCYICRHKRAGALHLIRRLRRHLPLEGKAKSARRNRATRLAKQTGFAPNTETFSAVHNISVVCLSRLARSPGGLGGRSSIEPRLLISSLFAGANRGSLRGAVP